MTNLVCGGSYQAARMWMAIDVHGNTNQAVQVIQVVDTTPPTIVCPPSMVLEFADTNGAVAAFTVTASDVCSPISLVVSPASGSLFPIGTTTVQATAVDGCTNTSSCSFQVTVLGPRGVKSNVLAELIALRPAFAGEPVLLEKLNTAITHLANSLEPKYWIDETHLVPKIGNYAFNQEKLCVSKLDNLLKAKALPVPEAVIQGFVDRITRSDRLLAVISIQEADAAGLNERKVAQDFGFLLQGDEAVLAEHYESGIEHYRNAWRHALQLRLQVGLTAQGAVTIQFIGNETRIFAIEYSTNMVDWVPIAYPKPDGEGNCEFTDPDSVNNALRYYRVREL